VEKNLILKVNWVHRCFLTQIKKIIIAAIKVTSYTRNSLVVKTSRTRLFVLLKFLRGHLLSQYKSLVDIIVYDKPDQVCRFTIIYNLLSLTFNARLQVCISGNSADSIPSVCGLYASANWLEREV
jgi:NADH-quinone oxidoreductase subunit C